MNPCRVSVVTLACLAALAAPSSAEDKVPGEKWKQSVAGKQRLKSLFGGG